MAAFFSRELPRNYLHIFIDLTSLFIIEHMLIPINYKL